MKNVLLVLVTCFFYGSTTGQDSNIPDQSSSIGVRVGYGLFNMGDMKTLQKSFMDDSNIPFEATNDFPGYLVYELNCKFPVGENLFIGGLIGFKSTGGRLHYGDYSGEAFINQQLKEYSIGTGLTTLVVQSEKYQLPLYFNTAIGFTDLKLINELTLSNQTSNEEYNFRSIGVLFEPGIGIHRYLSRFDIGVDLGYQFNINGKLYLDGDNSSYLIDDQDEPIKAQWDGVRLFLCVGYKFF